MYVVVASTVALPVSTGSDQAGERSLASVLASALVGGTLRSVASPTAKTWGFYDVSFKGKAFEFQRPYGSYVMENVLFKISFPAEFHSQTAVEAAVTLHAQLADHPLIRRNE